jgi:pimeloyl-ACP methyl ester carboxylesterase
MLSHMLQVRIHYRAPRLAALVVAAAAGLLAGPAAAQSPDMSRLIVYVNGTRLGEVESSVQRTAEGWTVSSTGRLSPPLDLVTRRLVIRYGPDWSPLGLDIEAVSRGLPLNIRTIVTGASATTEVTQQGQAIPKTDTLSPRALLLPNLFFASFEALALQLSAMTGDSARFPAYIVPQAEIQLDAKRVGEETIETPEGALRSRRFSVTFPNAGAALASDVWVDERGRLLRFGVVAQGLVIVREDISSVGIRRQNISRAGDQAVQISANGFTLVGTLGKPSGEPDAKGRYPAVIMVAGSGLADRDETVAGIPIFGQIAGALADAGFMVVRYDKRGVGQSGGRAESATIADYADDVLAVFRFLEKRKDVDDRRIAVFGHSEGAMVALLAAARQKQIAALVLAAAPSGAGAELVLEQQQTLLAQTTLTEEEKNARIELQRRIQAAVLGAGDWTGVPEDLRRQADTPWFRSFLAFDPARPLKDLRQPILVLQGDRDTQVLSHHAAKLAELARARKGRPPDSVRVVELKGVNHLLVPAETGQVGEYASLAGRSVTPEVASATVAFLKEKMAARR